MALPQILLIQTAPDLAGLTAGLLPALKVSRSLLRPGAAGLPAADDAVELVRVVRTVVDAVAHHAGLDAGVRVGDALEVRGLAGVGHDRWTGWTCRLSRRHFVATTAALEV